MKRPAFVQRIVNLAVCGLAAAALLAVSLPHGHDLRAPDASESCRLQKVHQGFSPAPDATQLVQDVLRLVAHDWLSPHDVPRTNLVVRPSAPRAPPVLS